MAERCEDCGRDVDMVISVEYNGRKSPNRCPGCQKKVYARIRDAAKGKKGEATK